MKRRYVHGAEVLRGGGVHFRVWAPLARSVELAIESERAPIAMTVTQDGWHEARVERARAGTRYRYVLDGQGPFPDPASRFQPDGVHGPSQVVDPTTFAWTDGEWRGVSIAGQIFYELHVGTFTREGTWAAAMERLPALVDLGITTVEMMPVADFAGEFGWGYDGVDLWAPTRAYGSPDDLRRFVDRAHALGLGVILDVVYNHLGPSGNYLPKFGPYLAKRATEWGESIHFDGEGLQGVRDFYVENAAYWIDEYHFDGLRLDATHCIWDTSDEHVLAAIARRARAAAGKRSIVLVAESETQDPTLVREYGLDAIWNDDFHHTMRVAATGRREAYLRDYRGSAQEIVSCAKRGFLYQGQRYEWQNKRRGSAALDLAPTHFVHYTENHDQVSNSATGARVHELTSPGRHRVTTALLMLLPQSPMLFQGQEMDESAPFVFFADHEPELAKAVRKGRTEFLSQLQSIAQNESVRARILAPERRETFEACKIDHGESARNAAAYALHRDLIVLRKGDPVFASQRAPDGAVLCDGAFVLRFFGGAHGDRLVVVNLGSDRVLDIAPEPLLAPPAGARWRAMWSSEDPKYGGYGAPAVEDADGRWHLTSESLVVLAPEREP